MTMRAPVLSYMGDPTYVTAPASRPNVVARAHMRSGVTFVTVQQVPA